MRSIKSLLAEHRKSLISPTEPTEMVIVRPGSTQWLTAADMKRHISNAKNNGTIIRLEGWSFIATWMDAPVQFDNIVLEFTADETKGVTVLEEQHTTFGKSLPIAPWALIQLISTKNEEVSNVYL